MEATIEVVTTDLFTLSTNLPFPECYIVATIQRVAFSDRFLSLSNLRSLHAFSELDSI